MDYIRIYWKGPFTLDQLKDKPFSRDTRFNFYLLTTLDEYRFPQIEYIGKTTQTIIGRLENHHKWNEIRGSIQNPLKERIDSLIKENTRMKLFIESLVDNLEERQTLLGKIIRDLQMNDIYIFVGKAMISNKPFRAQIIEKVIPTISSTQITDDYIDPIENALIYSIKPEYNNRLKDKYRYPNKQLEIKNLTNRSIIIDDIDTGNFEC